MRYRRLSLALACGLVAGTFTTIAAPAAAATTEVTVSEFFFAPEDVTVKTGETVRWRFAGKAPHTATAFEGEFDSGTRYSGTFAHTFEEPGTYGYFCAIHPDMEGTVTVTPSAPTALSAQDTVGAAIAWSRLSFEDGTAGTVILGRSDVFADSLSSGGLQGQLDAPLLLTPSDSLASAVRAELERLGARRVVLLGGRQAVSAAVEGQLRDAGYRVSRVSGDNRYATATAVADQFLADTDTALIARGTGDAQDPTRAWVDSLGAGAVSARNGWPVLLSATEGLSRETQAYLESSIIETVLLVGGEAALSAKVAADIERLGIAVERLGGDDRFATAQIVAEETGIAHDMDYALVVSGRDANAWASGFAAAAAADRLKGSIVLSDGDDFRSSAYPAFLFSTVAVACGPFVDETACAKAGTASNATPNFELPSSGQTIGFFSGEQEPEGGVEGAEGVALVSGTSDPGAVCYETWVPAIEMLDGPVTAAHIHEGEEGVSGPPVVTLSTESAFDGEYDVVNCAFGLDPALVDDILTNPTGYYVNLHTDAHPKGATRAQLFTSDRVFLADKTGDQEVDGGAQGAGGFGVYLTSVQDPGLFCQGTFAFGIDWPATAAHVHEGDVGVSGPPVITLETPTEFGEGSGFGATFACVDADPEVVAAVEADPFHYYVNIHTEAHPAGAIRGQLFDPFEEPEAFEEGPQSAEFRTSARAVTGS